MTTRIAPEHDTRDISPEDVLTDDLDSDTHTCQRAVRECAVYGGLPD